MAIRAVQQFMLGTVLGGEGQARETLAAVRRAGYDGIELCGFMIRRTPLFVKMLTRLSGMPVGRGGGLDWPALTGEAGLRVVALHEDLGSIEGDAERVIRDAKALGARYVVVTGVYRFDFSSAQAVEGLAGRLNRAGALLRGGGLQLLYHNHNAELRRVAPDKSAYRLLMEATDPGDVGFELDAYWLAEAGADALQMMRALGSRMKLLHINDRGTRMAGSSMTPILKSDSMELGDGNMPIEALLAQALKAPVDAVILESHRNWIDGSPVKSLQRSAEFLNRHL